MWRDQRAEIGRYAEEDPGEVVAQIEMASMLTARAFAVLTPEQWARTCIYNFPEPAVRTMQWLGAQTVHEAEHHLGDIALAIGR
jgi:hypothetical protein